jgi:PDDEXK-like domain of unknown function (DUF3799)
MACRRCGEPGHTRRTCTAGYVVGEAVPDLLGALAASVERARAERPEQSALREAVEAGQSKPAADQLEVPADDPTQDAEAWAVQRRTHCPACGSTDVEVLGRVEAGTTPAYDVDMVVRQCGQCGGEWEFEAVSEQERRIARAFGVPARIAGIPAGPMLQGPNWVPWRTWRGPAEPIQVTRPGVYQLDADEYHADPVPGGSLSNSDARRLTAPGCPALFRYEKDNGVRQTSDAFDFGHLVHTLILGKGEEIAVRPAEWADYRKPAARVWRDEQRAAGRTPVTPEEMVKAESMVEALRADEFASQALAQPGRSEQCLFWQDPETGCWRRAMIDHLPVRPKPGQRMVIVDYKTSDEVCPDDQMMRKVFNYGYHRQGATYLDGVLALGLADDAVIVFIFQQKSPPFLVTPVVLRPEWIRIGRVENRWALREFAECLESGVWPGYAPEGPVVLDVPRWLEIRFDGVTA